EFHPCAVMLDLGLPDIDGWTVFDQLKHDPETRHIPVHMLSGQDMAERALRHGARAFLGKPVARARLQEEFAAMREYNDRERRNLLIVDDDAAQRTSLIELLDADDLHIITAATGEAALAALAEQQIDCVVLDLALPDT